METLGNWFRKNANTVIILLVIFGLALFLRAYFPLEESLQKHLLSGGSDSFYYEHIIRHIVDTGHHLDWDPALSYPMGLGNPRPPIFSWFIAVPGIVLSPLVGDVWQSVFTVFVLSTAIWGALTVFPTYFLTKSIFGRRAGLIAAFLLAVMPAHLQRSQATDADHDSIALFFVVTSFFFFMKALEVINEKRWVASWDIRTKENRSGMLAGLKQFFKENRKSLLYSVMSGMAMATVALLWQGWAYAPIILLVYVVLQLFVDRLRERDPMGMGICFTLTMGVAFLVAAPWYLLYGQTKVWFDVPLILFLVAAALGFVLTVTRNYPWAIVIPSILIAGGAVLAVLMVVSPTVATAFVSGAGYFVRTKLYETIAEAQPPGLSQAILSFGAATYYVSLFGLLLMAIRLPKRLERDYLFILTWSFAAVFMSMAAARFIFNASPAFALTAGGVIGFLVEKLDFEGMKRTFSSLAGGSKLSALRKSVRPRHVLGSLVIVFLLLLPNVWYGVDASIPYEDKAKYDRQVYYSMPEFLRPQGYTPPTGRSSGTFYFGAFGYSLPLPNSYFPAAWDWFAEQDSALPEVNRPAYLSWWDYGFEAIDRGRHPTVADNFQNGYQLAGQFITAQDESAAISLLILRLIEGDYYGHGGQLSEGVTRALETWRVDPAKVVGSLRNPSALTSTVLGDPITYGRWDSRMQPTNALYIYLSKYLSTQLTTDEIAALYHEIRDATGWSIRYFGVDSRMFPYDGGGNNIFYAPVKLSDHRVRDLPDGRVLPVDFFRIEAETDKGTFPVELVPLDARVNRLDVKYSDMFYKSMFYRAYMGFGPSDVGQTCQTNDCLPGIRGELSQMMPMQAWNLSHFKLVYKTAYYNPWPIGEIQNHTEDWAAMNYFDALDYAREINRNQRTGIVDFSNQTLARSGVVFLKYYDGAYVNGTVTVDGVTPLSGVRVTIQDYEDPSNPTPHYSVLTDSQGRYSLLAPFGTLKIVVSSGTVNQRTMTGSNILDQDFLVVTDDQAMRRESDRDGDGLPDYEIKKDIVVRGVTITGTAFLDFDGDGNQSYGEEVVSEARITFKHGDLGLESDVTTNAQGMYVFSHAYKGTYASTITYRGRVFKGPSIKAEESDATQNLAIGVTKLEGVVVLPKEFAAANALVTAYDEAWGNSATTRTDKLGHYTLYLLSGNFTISAALEFNASIPTRISVGGSTPSTFNITLTPSGRVQGRTSVAGLLQGQVLLNFQRRGGSEVNVTAMSDASGSYVLRIPTGTYDVYARHYKAGILYAFLGRTTVTEGGETEFDPNLSEGVVVEGAAYSVDKSRGGIGLLDISFASGQGVLRTKTSREGRYTVYLPKGDYDIQVGYYNLTFLKRVTFVASQTCDIDLGVGILVRAQIFYDKNGNGFVEPDEGVPDAVVTFTDTSGIAAEAITDAGGRFQLTVPGDRTYTMRVTGAGFQTLTIGPGTVQALAPRFTSSIVPLNITVFGRLLREGSTLAAEQVRMVFNVTGEGGMTYTAYSDSSGDYAVSIAPGNYEVEIDQPVVPGLEDVRYQNFREESLSLLIGSEDVRRDIAVVIRSTVSGDVTLYGARKDALLVLQGPESKELVAENGTFSLMLAAGDYTLYASYNESGAAYAVFQKLSVAGPQIVHVQLARAAVVQGSLTFGAPDARLTEVAPISFVSDQGASFETLTSAEGSYSLDLIPGTYTVSVNFRSNTTIDYVLRYVRYSHTSTLVVNVGQIVATHDLPLERTLDNSTIRGRLIYNGLPAGASLEFRPSTPDGLNGTTAAGSDGIYTIQLAPGPYVMYVHDPVTHAVSLQSITVEPRSDMYLNLSLERSYKVSGVTRYLSNVRIASRVTFSSSVTWEVYTDKTGYFEAFLPPLRYSVTVGTILKEHGLNIGYNASSIATVDGDTVANFDLVRVPRRGVYLSVVDEATTPLMGPYSGGESVQYTIKVHNSGSMYDMYKLEGATVGWDIQFDRSTVGVDFGTVNGREVNTTRVTATVKVPFDAKVEHPPVSITAYSVNETVIRYTLRLKLDVERTRGLILRLTDQKPTFDGRFLNYTIEIANTGNGAERVGVSVENSDSVRYLGWNALIAANSTAPRGVRVEGIIVGANTTARVTLVLQAQGGGEGVQVKLRAYLQDDSAYESVLLVPTSLPRIQLEGGIAVAGTGIARQESLSPVLITVTVSLGFVAAVFLVTFLRDRLRRRKR